MTSDAEGASAASKDRIALRYALAWVAFALAMIVGGGLLAVYLSGAPEREGLRLCDEAIKAALKAPSTYKRVKGPRTVHVQGSRTYVLEYDAANGFGVPLRGWGSCEVSGDRSGAKWIEYNF